MTTTWQWWWDVVRESRRHDPSRRRLLRAGAGALGAGLVLGLPEWACAWGTDARRLWALDVAHHYMTTWYRAHGHRTTDLCLIGDNQIVDAIAQQMPLTMRFTVPWMPEATLMFEGLPLVSSGRRGWDLSIQTRDTYMGRPCHG